ncbi:Glu-tRNA(Gln) amidotransferase subunit GatD [Candidatus Woesearchaeota archaeon]|jgi:glutamyl-tRNA(Gln) amidotransferase subunit D|nr:Glu-tRNA(Gln) amidotransferase subunit GatD [Candidatus Woesearchaeota archaeon]MBT5342605.1 Glu-tRNA(Gln) amidotransferase subunit GatD [Candidatus Woesearchaeota archaeon]
MTHPGDLVEIKTHAQTEQGILMPDPDENTIIIKLDNGYNLGFARKEVLSIKLLEKRKESQKEEKEKSFDKKKKTILILHTGGTIASKVDYKTGAVSAKFTAEDLLEMFPELNSVANIETELVSNMMSEDMRFDNYQKMAEAIKKHAKKKIAGIIIGHGTDTLGYTAAALSFMFEKINIPVLLVGSQRSSDRGSTDATQNLICAAEFIIKTKFVGVAVCMHNSASDDVCAILPATKTRKMHTSRRDAFKAINDSPIALVDYNKRTVKFLNENYSKKTKDNELILKEKLSEKVGLLKVHPNIDPKLFKFFTENYKAFVIEGTGLGHAPTNMGVNLKNFELLKNFIKNGGIVAMTSQCLYGAVHPYVYTNLRKLSEIGCLFCEDMLPETAFIKLSWLMGNYPEDKVKELMVKNLRGEINTTRTYEKEFI